MKNNNKEIYKINKRQIDILHKYYEVDEENKLVSVKFNLESDKEMLETSIGKDDSSMFNYELLNKINSIFESIPFVYKIDIEFDVGGELSQSPQKTLEAFNDTLELGQITSRKDNRRKWLIATMLVMSGILLLFFMIISSHYSWFGDGLQGEIIAEIIDISAWVFLWEAVTILFLEPSEKRILNLKIKNRVNSIAIYKKGEDKPLVLEHSKDIFGEWEDESKIKKYGKIALLISSAAFICMGFYSCYSLIKFFFENQNIDTGIIFVSSIIGFLTFAIYILAGLGGLFRYSNRKNLLSKLVGPFAILLILQLVFILTMSAISSEWSAITSSISGLIINILYIFGYFAERKD